MFASFNQPITSRELSSVTNTDKDKVTVDNINNYFVTFYFTLPYTDSIAEFDKLIFQAYNENYANYVHEQFCNSFATSYKLHDNSYISTILAIKQYININIDSFSINQIWSYVKDFDIYNITYQFIYKNIIQRFHVNMQTNINMDKSMLYSSYTASNVIFQRIADLVVTFINNFDINKDIDKFVHQLYYSSFILTVNNETLKNCNNLTDAINHMKQYINFEFKNQHIFKVEDDSNNNKFNLPAKIVTDTEKNVKHTILINLNVPLNQ